MEEAKTNKRWALVLVKNLRKGDVFKLPNGHTRTVLRVERGRWNPKVVAHVHCTNGKMYHYSFQKWIHQGRVRALRAPG